ncbi:hypothetical protein ACP70R_012014 [Stipagrostis hirtigluma subsp. patula]
MSMMQASRAVAAAALRRAAQGHRRSPSAAGMATATIPGLPKGKPWADYVPVYGALGAIALSVTLGLGTASHELAHAPNVRLDKKKRETVPEVAAPDLAVDEADRFLAGSLVRKVARIRGDDRAIAAVAEKKKVVTLKDAGVDPPGIEQSREEVLSTMNIFKRNTA